MDDLIRRSEAIEILENTDWYHQNRNKDMVSGANPDEHQAWYKAEDVYKALEGVPSAQPEKKVVAEIKVDTDEIMERLEQEWHKPNEWIPCSEQLPEVGREILFCDDFGDSFVGHRATEHWWSVDDTVKSVVAWMPLPEPYKDGDADETD